MQFSIDQPTATDRALQRLTKFSLWCLSDAGVPPRAIEIHLGGRPAYALRRCFRGDLASRLSEVPLAGESGFFGDVLIPPEIANGRELGVAVTANFEDGSSALLESRSFVVEGEAPQVAIRSRSYCLDEFLTAGDEAGNGKLFRPERQDILGVPHFHPRGEFPILQLLDANATHPYSDNARRVIDSVPAAGVFMDLGCGVKAPDAVRDNAVLLDAIHFPRVDVVNTCTKLPFRSEVFDAIVSQAVFEHLPYPHQTAAECLRVLKPGGLLLIDTAFMQPLHADPSHYFNMTLEALRLVLDGFEILDAGSRSYQYPSCSLKMQIDEVLPFIRHGRWRERLEVWRAQLAAGGAEFDDDLGPIGREILAAGVYALARKPFR
jgi:SAM-dependent methyltransferase